MTLRRDLEVLIVEDALSGQGKAGLELRWQLAQPVRPGLSPEARERVEALQRGARAGRSRPRADRRSRE